MNRASLTSRSVNGEHTLPACPVPHLAERHPPESEAAPNSTQSRDDQGSTNLPPASPNPDPDDRSRPPSPRSTPSSDRIRLLSFLYGRSSAANHFLRRRIRGAGVACGLLIIIAGLFSMGRGTPPVFQILSLTLGLVAVSFTGAFFRSARLQARRSLPHHATVGEKIRYMVRVKNLGRRTIDHAWLAETAPDPRPAADHFAAVREPGEHRRNPFDRFFLYYRWRWLVEHLRRFKGGHSADRLHAPPSETATVWIELTPRRRGVFKLDDLRVLMPDPLGVFQRCHPIEARPDTLTVLPRRYRIPEIDLPGEARFQIGGDTPSRTTGQSGEFIGLRDYRPGDPLRLIHWRSWARTGRPIVREIEDTFFPRHGLVLDTFARPADEACFEEAVSIAASFASTIEHRECLLDLMFLHDRAHRFTAGRGIARAEKMLEVLAAAEMDTHGDFPALTRLVLTHRDDLASCLCVMVGWDSRRASFVRDLLRGGVSPIILAIFPDEQQARSATDESPPPAPFLPLIAGSIQSGLHQLPRLLAS